MISCSFDLLVADAMDSLNLGVLISPLISHLVSRHSFFVALLPFKCKALLFELSLRFIIHLNWDETSDDIGFV